MSAVVTVSAAIRRSQHPSIGLRTVIAAGLLAVLAACASNGEKPKPVALPADAGPLQVRQVWAAHLPAGAAALRIAVNGDLVTVAASDGTVAAIDAASGTERWRASIGTPLLAGVGSDGNLAAVITQGNELVVLKDGRVLWRQRLAAQGYTAPWVAGQRVFVQTADRTLAAWDGLSGRRLWSQSRTADTLVLKRPGVLLAVGDTLVAGVGGRLAGVNPANGSARWEAPIAAPRGTNEVERLVDLTGPASRSGDVVCARAYQASVGCVDTAKAALRWSRPSVGAEGLGGDARQVYGTEANGDVAAWRRDDGTPAWVSQRLRHRGLGAPLAVGRMLAIGEDTGTLHFMSSEDGTLLGRVSPDGSGIAATPVLAGRTVVVATRNGGLFGYRTE